MSCLDVPQEGPEKVSKMRAGQIDGVGQARLGSRIGSATRRLWKGEAGGGIIVSSEQKPQFVPCQLP
jgi:hypothetical protein